MWCRALLHCAPAFGLYRASLQRMSCLYSDAQYIRVLSPAFPKPHRRMFRSSSSIATSDPTNKLSGAPGVESSGEKFVMIYTCAVCEIRSAKTISKHAYYKGVVLVRCPGCENLHLVADRLGWFEDDSTDVEILMQQKGEKIRFVKEDNVLELTEKDILGDSKK